VEDARRDMFILTALDQVAASIVDPTIREQVHATVLAGLEARLRTLESSYRERSKTLSTARVGDRKFVQGKPAALVAQERSYK
jgi:hypothetical protein